MASQKEIPGIAKAEKRIVSALNGLNPVIVALAMGSAIKKEIAVAQSEEVKAWLVAARSAAVTMKRVQRMLEMEMSERNLDARYEADQPLQSRTRR